MTRRPLPDDLIEQAVQMRLSGMGRNAICAALRISANTITYRVEIIVRQRLAQQAAANPPATVPQQAVRPSKGTGHEDVLEAGNPLSWGAITAGTLLDGVPFRALSRG